MAKASASDKRKITVDANEFRRTRDALTTVFVSLSSSIEKAVKAYIEHTDLVIAGDATLNVSHLLEPFNVIQKTAQSLAAPAPAPASTQALVEAPQPDDANGAKKKKKRAYKPRDPNAPRRPLTAYFRYLGEVRPLIAAELQKAGTPHKPGDLSVIATERWKELSREEHEPYHEAYRRELVKYKAALADYLARNGIEPGKAVVLGPEDDDDEDGADNVEFYEAANHPPARPALSDSDTDSDDDDDDDDEMIAPPAPPPVVKPRKSTGSEAVAKTPKSSKKASKVVADTAARTPIFSSISSGATKKRKADEADSAVPGEKKARGRPPKSGTSEKKEKKRRLSDDN